MKKKLILKIQLIVRVEYMGRGKIHWRNFFRSQFYFKG